MTDAGTLEQETKGTYERVIDNIVTYLGVGIALFSIIYVSHIIDYFGYYLDISIYLGFFLSLCLAMVFLVYPARKGRSGNGPAWYDLLLIPLAMTGPIYFGIILSQDVDSILRLSSGRFSTYEMAFIALSLITILEATRRVIGPPMAIVALIFLFYRQIEAGLYFSDNLYFAQIICL